MKLPFEAFTVHLPEGLFMYPDGTEVKAAEVHRHSNADGIPRRWITLLTSAKYNRYLLGASTRELRRRVTADPARAPCEVAVLNTLVNMATMLCDKSTMKPVGSSHGSWAKYGKHRAGKEPTRLVFQVTHDVKHDFRNDLRQYTSGNGHRLTVQFMVRGHWRNQACGERHSERKQMFIEPYWKGAVDAPVALRSHTITTIEGEATT
jgi:hypothetical protein